MNAFFCWLKTRLLFGGAEASFVVCGTLLLVGETSSEMIKVDLKQYVFQLSWRVFLSQQRLEIVLSVVDQHGNLTDSMRVRNCPA